MPISVLRFVKKHGFEVTLAYYMDAPFGVAVDSVDDFRKSRSILDMRNRIDPTDWEFLHKFTSTKKVDLVLQVGSPYAYQQIAYLHEKTPKLPIVEWAFNTSEHFHSFSQFARSFCAIVVESEHMKKSVMELPLYPPIEVIPSGTRLAGKTELETPVSVPGKTRVGFVGRLSPEKNPLGFIQFAREFTTGTEMFEFSVSGRGPQREAVLSAIRSINLPHLLKFNKYEPEVALALRRLDILVVPSKLDGRPAIIMEANSLGIPVVASDVGGIPQLVTEGNNGYLFDYSDFHSFKKAVLATRDRLCDPDKPNWSLQISEYARKNFSRSGMDSKYLEFFTRVLED
jgi:glycosyltransferase involved in cell wall biosynthesis